ncbi:hypothetical protein D3C80_1143310 [compost metagenome]
MAKNKPTMADRFNPKFPQIWFAKPSKGMVECILIDEMGNGPNFIRLWVPVKEKDTRDTWLAKVLKRVKKDFGKEIERYSELASNQSPLDKWHVTK